MTLFNELQERWKAIFLERETVEKRADQLADDMQELEVALSALQSLHTQKADAEPDLFEDEKVEASEHLADDHPLPAVADDVVTEIEASNQSESCVLSLGAETGLQPSPGGVEESPDQFEERAALDADMQDEREQPAEGYAPVTNPEADFWARTLTEQPKPQSYSPFNIFRREKEDA